MPTPETTLNIKLQPPSTEPPKPQPKLAQEVEAQPGPCGLCEAALNSDFLGKKTFRHKHIQELTLERIAS